MSSSDIKVSENHYSDANNETEKWTRLPSMNTPRAGFGATAIGGKIYVAGGCNSKEEYLSDVEVYNSQSNKSSRLPNMKEERSYCAVTSVGGKVYALGGRDYQRKILASCEMFDPATNRWTDIPSMKKPRSACAACVIGDMLYVIGGASNDNDESLSSVEMFDTVTKKWSSIPNMTTKRLGCAAVSVGNKIYVFGGVSPSAYFCNNVVSSCEVYDITTQGWTQLPEMQEKRVWCAATVVGNKIYVVGGHDGNQLHSSCEVFDICTNTWSYIPNMLLVRSGCQAVSICSKIVVMGGQNDSTVHSSVEAFDTITDRSIPPREEETLKIISQLPVMLYMCMVLFTQMMKKDKIDTIMNSNTEDGQQATQTNVLTRHVTSTNDSTRSSSMTAHQRVLLIEENIGQTHDSSAILIKRIEFLEIHVLGEIQNTGKSLTKRIADLEVSFFGN